ncbi:M1 family metallopeptidase [Paenibacillus xylanexedens]|uniref:M1 family metallopeptidase n=1 Tax=Paenibacillus xylanexedens TaxID=528191 RepID=UPI00119EB7BE|nr:M1 family metallopeptidase [Paenibacillus xylanexedens]
MKHSSPFKSKFVKTGITAALTLMFAAYPLVNTDYAIAQSVTATNPSTGLTQTIQNNVKQQASIQYHIQAKLNEKDMILEGSERITYLNTSKDTLGQLVLHTYADANRSASTQADTFAQSNVQISQNSPDKTPQDFLGGIDIKQVTMAGGQALNYKNENQALTVQLPTPLQPGASISLQIDFHLKIPYGLQRISYYKDIINGAHWFPVMSVYDEGKHAWNTAPYSRTFESDYYTSSDFDVQLSVPEDYEVAMPGVMTTREDAEQGRKIISAQANNTREFVLFASPNYTVASVTRNGLTVEYYYLDNEPGKQEIAEQYIDQAFKAMEFFGKKYGKYPYPEFRIVESYVENVAVEYSRLIQMGQMSTDSLPEKDTTFIHEIAHQWFHALIGNDSEDESFLDEAFADFSMVYFQEKQGDKLNGFNALRFDNEPVDLAIASTNEEAGDLAGLLYYQKGRQAIYQLYRSVGEEKFDAFMQAYFKRYVYQNATIDGLLQTIEDVLGHEQRKEMETALLQPNFVLKPEFQLSLEERTAYFHDVFQLQYQASLNLVPDLPVEVMNRLMAKVLQDEPLTIVLSDQLSKQADKQQEAIMGQLTAFFNSSGVKYDVVKDRGELKQKMKSEISTSNLIVFGTAKNNGFVQALKPSIIDRAKQIGFAWKDTMEQPHAAGAYITKHPYNQNRLMLHYFWNEDHLKEETVQAYLLQMQSTIGFTNDYYQYYVLNEQGQEIDVEKIENPIAHYFSEE